MDLTPEQIVRYEEAGPKVVLLDQRRLPDEVVELECRSAAEIAAAIRDMAIRGAPAIGVAAAYGLALAAERGEDLDEAAALLAASRPTAVNAVGALRTAWERGLLERVWVDETRPLLQGSRLTAWELEAVGVPHAVIADSAAASLMAAGEVDCVVTGADRIAANGDTANKIGTYALAVLASHHNIPFYVVAPTSTVDLATPSGAAIPIEERSPDELTTRFPARNPAFDVTPAALIAAIVTEHGVHRAPFSES